MREIWRGIWLGIGIASLALAMTARLLRSLRSLAMTTAPSLRSRPRRLKQSLAMAGGVLIAVFAFQVFPQNGILDFVNSLRSYKIGTSFTLQAEAATATSTSFKSVDSEAVIFGGLATSTSFRNVGAGQAVLGTAASASFKHEIGILYFEPPAVPAAEVPPSGGGGTLFLKDEIASPREAELAMTDAMTEAELLAMTRAEAEGLLRSLRELAMTRVASLRGEAEAISVKIREIIFPPKPPELLPIEEVVTAIPPLALGGQWILLPRKAIAEFTLAPLPREMELLALKFPGLKQTFKEVGVVKATDVSKLKSTQLVLPGLSETIGLTVTPSLAKRLKQLPAFTEMSELEIARLPKEKIAREIERIGRVSPELVEGLPLVQLMPGRFVLPAGLPLAQLPPELKRQLPTDIVFTRGGGELIDLPATLSLTDKGETRQKIFTVANQTLKLAVKPDRPVSRVRGLLTYREERGPERITLEISARELAASAIFAVPELEEYGGGVIASPAGEAISAGDEIAAGEEIASVASLPRNDDAGGARNDGDSGGIASSLASLAPRNDDANVGDASPSQSVIANPPAGGEVIPTELVLLEFDYNDDDGDGIWTAEIQAPVVEGQYEVLTIFEYEDELARPRVARLLVVVDPEGYIYEQAGDRQIRVPGAIVSLFQLNERTAAYELWPAAEFNQRNPQTTDVTGRYAFLVPVGTYYIKVEAPGYPTYEGKPFVVRENSGIHANIELKALFWWLKQVNAMWLVIAGMFALLLWNFWRDKMKARAYRVS